MPSVMAAWYVSLFLVTRNLRPTLMIRNMRSTQNINICCGPAEPVPLTLQWIYKAIQKHDIDAESKALLTDGHKEILQTECYEDYGYPSYIE